jgi:hypothetical protein
MSGGLIMKAALDGSSARVIALISRSRTNVYFADSARIYTVPKYA